MSIFQENLVGMGPMCDAYYKVTFTKHAVTIKRFTGTPIIPDWHESDGPCLWRIYLLPNSENVPPLSSAPDIHKASLQYFSTYDLTSVEALVQ